jgi:hypothetical protein
VPVPIPGVANPTPACKNPEWVKTWTRLSIEHGEASNDLWILTGVLTICAVIPGPQQVGCGLGAGAAGTTAGVAGKLSSVYARWANDPPDANYKASSEPAIVLPDPLRVRVARGVPRRAADALQRLLYNMADEASHIRALTHAFERSQGAAQAADVEWEQTQRSDAAASARGLVRLIGNDRRLRERAIKALRTSPALALRLPSAVVRSAQRRVRANGFPARLRRQMARAGLTERERARIRAAFLSTDPKVLSQWSVRSLVARGGVPVATQRADADAFGQLATAVTARVATGEVASCANLAAGTATIKTGEQFGYTVSSGKYTATFTFQWGDGASSTATLNPGESREFAHPYSTPGTYHVRITVNGTTAGGESCATDQQIGTVTVVP